MPSAAATIRETKRTLDGRRQSFDCGLVAVTPRLAIVRFDHTAARSAGGFFFPEGSHTFGFFWAGRHYNLYRFTGPDGAVIAYRFDVVDSVRITPAHIGYTDLYLDAWLPPGGGGSCVWTVPGHQNRAAAAEKRSRIGGERLGPSVKMATLMGSISLPE